MTIDPQEFDARQRLYNELHGLMRAWASREKEAGISVAGSCFQHSNTFDHSIDELQTRIVKARIYRALASEFSSLAQAEAQRQLYDSVNKQDGNAEPVATGE